ncbi:MAG: O-methyltransferase [Pseudobdellovibrionaceae bacterium]
MRQVVMRELSSKIDYLESLAPPPAQLEGLLRLARSFSDELNKTQISLSHHEAQLVAHFFKLNQVRTVLEIGALTGFSALYWAWAVGPQGRVWTIEKDTAHAQKCREISQLAKTELQFSIQVIEGDAEMKLAESASWGLPEVVDAVFIDGNKAAYGKYLDWALAHTKSGSVIVADNVFLWGGAWGDQNSVASAKQIEVMKKVNETLMDSDRFLRLMIPTAEGLLMAVRRSTAADLSGR